MSLNAHSACRSARRRCSCGRRAGYYSVYRHCWTRRDDHSLCPGCYRSLWDATRAAGLAEEDAEGSGEDLRELRRAG